MPAKTLMGFEPFEGGIFFRKVASNRPKIGQQVARG